jgi:adenine-specific DNA-methyltransferase
VNYIGSKYKLASFISSEIIRVCGSAINKTYAELFGGTGAVARVLKDRFKKVIVNDAEEYAYVLLRHYIGNTRFIDSIDKIYELNKIKPVKGFIYTNYCAGSGSGRNYFTDNNGMKVDAMRLQIEHWKNNRIASEDEYYLLLASLLECADALANTASVYGAFLKHIKKSASASLHLTEAPYTKCQTETLVYKEDANQLIKKIKGDVLYLDPPYNQRQYGANYHLLNTITLYDTFIPQGKTGLRPDYNRSAYCSRAQVAHAFDALIAAADFEFIFISYNNEGLLQEDILKKICEQYGSYQLIRKNYQRFRADKPDARQHKASKTEEHLHVLIKK